MDIEKIIDEEFQAISHLLEKCWDGYQRNYDVPKGEQGSCEIKKEAAEDAGEHVANKAVRDGTTNAEALKAFLNDPPIPDNEVGPWLKNHGLEPEERGYRSGANVDDTHLNIFYSYLKHYPFFLSSRRRTLYPYRQFIKLR